MVGLRTNPFFQLVQSTRHLPGGWFRSLKSESGGQAAAFAEVERQEQQADNQVMPIANAVIAPTNNVDVVVHPFDGHQKPLLP